MQPQNASKNPHLQKSMGFFEEFKMMSMKSKEHMREIVNVNVTPKI
jgi:hypothetical protein